MLQSLIGPVTGILDKFIEILNYKNLNEKLIIDPASAWSSFIIFQGSSLCKYSFPNDRYHLFQTIFNQ